MGKSNWKPYNILCTDLGERRGMEPQKLIYFDILWERPISSERFKEKEAQLNFPHQVDVVDKK